MNDRGDRRALVDPLQTFRCEPEIGQIQYTIWLGYAPITPGKLMATTFGSPCRGIHPAEIPFDVTSPELVLRWVC